MLLRPCHSVCERAWKDEETIKTMKCFFSFPPTHFSFGWAFLAHWGGGGGSGGSRRRLMERATWTNPVWNQGARTARPSQIYDPPPLFSHTEAPLWSFWMYRTLSVTFCHLCLPLLPLPFLSHFPLPLFLYLGISFLSFTPSFFPRHPGQLFIQTGCLQLSVRSWAAAPEVGRVARGAELFPNTSVSSLCNIHDLSATLTPQLHVFCKTTHTHCTEAVQRRQRAQSVRDKYLHSGLRHTESLFRLKKSIQHTNTL